MKTFFGHPSALRVLFFTELWERFSYYGMRAILVLFMVAPQTREGMGIDDTEAASVYGLYTMCVYMVALPGGWLADNFFGLRKAVFCGGCVITLGHFVMAFPGQESFFAGLTLIVIGTGLLKPNISVMVGNLYADHAQAKRDAAFSIFYVGINIGGFVAPFVVGYLGERVNWHTGFACSGLGMLLGLLYFRHHWKKLDSLSSDVIAAAGSAHRKIKIGLLVFAISLASIFILIVTDVIPFSPIAVANYSFFILMACVVLYFTMLLIAGKLKRKERSNVLAIFVLFVFSIVFYSGYEQQGSSLTLFADRFTNRNIADFTIPASWFNALPSFYVFTLAPVFAWFWIWMSKNGIAASIPQKFAAGLIFTALGFFSMAAASYIFAMGTKASYLWLVLTYCLNTVGEICIYPVGLSAVSLLSPKRLSGQMMGVWFMSLALGNLLAGIYAGKFRAVEIIAQPMSQVYLFAIVGIFLLCAVAVLWILSRFFTRTAFETSAARESDNGI